MKLLKQIILSIMFVAFSLGQAHAAKNTEVLYYGAESMGILCGYSEVCITSIEKDGRKLIFLEENGEVKLTTLGAPFSTKFKYCFYIDKATGQFIYHESNYIQNENNISVLIEIKENKAYVTWKPQEKRDTVTLPPEVILPNFQVFPHLVKDFVKNTETEKSYKVLNLQDAKIHELVYSNPRTESLEFMGRKYEAVVLDELNLTTGQKSRFWINPENGYRLKTEFPNRTISLADKSVRNRIKAVNMDDKMVAKVYVIIPDVRAITYMKVKAQLEPRGLWVTPDSLNVPGQVFEGVVQNNQIDGIFEIKHKKYDGKNAPSFPPDFSAESSLKNYMEPEDVIESDDPVLVNKALEITENAVDSWEALKMLSKWVAEEIIYDIPGGMTARKTYDLKMGKCDAYSLLLAAFCRAVGIPARVVWGCMYIPHYGGGFVQHAWNEVYMGKAGWIPIDTTAEEVDFIDSSHIRIGELLSKSAAFNPKKMEILDYLPQPRQSPASEIPVIAKKYEPFLGNYMSNNGPYKDKILKVLVQNFGLAIEIPGRGVLELEEPDNNGLWYFKVTRQASVSFHRDETGGVNKLSLWIRTRLPKKADVETGSADVPKKFKPYLGKYPVPMEGIELEVIFKDEGLAIADSEGEVIKLMGPDENGHWIYKPGVYNVSFVFGDKEEVKAMVIHQIYEIPKIKSGADDYVNSLFSIQGTR